MELENIKRLHALASRLCDGDIDAQQVQELSALINNNQEAIREYLDYTSLHLNLEHKLRASRNPEEFADELAVRLSEDAHAAKAATQVSEPNSKTVRAFSILALAASVFLAAAFLMNSFKSQPSYSARIIQKIDCDWGDERWGIPQSPLLEVGREIKLDHGLMVLEFGDGAEVTLEAPVHFSIVAQDRGNLAFGKLSAIVPERSRGFSIEIPAGEVIDLGTRFGVLVDELGNCEAHVFQGNVLVRSDWGNHNHSPQEWKLAADEAIRLSTTAQRIEHLAAQHSLFVTYSRFNSVASIEELPALSIPEEGDLILWLDAAKSLQLDSSNRVIGWGNLSVGTNSTENNAWQVDLGRRPRWIKQTLGGRPAVRFDGSSHLVTSPFLSGDEVTIFCVLRPQQAEQFNRHFGQILSLNTTPDLILKITRDKQLAGVLSTRKVPTNKLQDIFLQSTLPNEDEPIVCTLIYSNSMNRAALFVNGDLVAESQAPSIASIQTPKYIGNSNQGEAGFVGDIGELLVFNSALNSDQRIQVCNALLEKYGIAPTQREPRVLSGIVPEEQ